MKIVYDKKDTQKHVLVPCTYKDYLTALNNEIPERWMREWMRLT
jgi:formiminoglutamase